MSQGLDLEKVIRSEKHWENPKVINPCTKIFILYCISNFPATQISRDEDKYKQFHRWVNEEAMGWNIPKELTRQMWGMRLRK